MKKLLSKLSGRLMTFLFPAALVASFLAPANVAAHMDMSNGHGGRGATEGDPLDTNDYGGSGGGGSDVQDQNGSGSPSIPFVFQLDRYQILLIPDFQGGTPTFRILVVEKTDLSLAGRSLEGTHAP